MLGAFAALAVDLHVASLTEAAVLEEVFVEPAFGSHEWVTGLVDKVVDLVDRTLRTKTFDEVITEGADAFLFFH